MYCRTIGLVTLSIFLFTLSAATDVVARSQTGKKLSTQPQKKQAKIVGFRSAKFGMKENSIYKAISKDFKILKKDVELKVHPIEQTTSIEITVPKLLGTGGHAKIAYILGFKSKRLFQVNILWGDGANKSQEKVNAQNVVDAANSIRNHLVKKQYQKEGYMINAPLDDANTVVFRGTDKRGRMALLVLTQTKNIESAKKNRERVLLKLSYIQKPDMPDIFTIKENDF